MKAVVFHGIGDIRIEDVAEPKIEEPTDAIVRLTASAICGTDLHFVRGTASGVSWCGPAPVDPTEILTQAEPLSGAIEAYEAFDRRDPGWIKVELVPAKAAE